MFIGQGCKVHLKKNELPSGILIISCSKTHYSCLRMEFFMILMIVQEVVPDVFMATGLNLTRFNFLYL